MNGKPSKKFQCAHYVSSFLPIPQNWIYRIVINHKEFRPIVLSRRKQNPELFPFSFLYNFDGLGKARQYLEILLFRIIKYFLFFKNVCKKNKVQLLHVHFGNQGVKMIGLKRKLRIPMICSFYGDDVYLNVNNSKYTSLFKEADKLLVLGPYMKSELIKMGCAENKISIHHLGIDVHTIRFSKRRIDKSRAIRFLIASSFVAKKGIDLAIKALAKFKDDYDYTLDIIGDGPLKEEVLHAVVNSGIEDRIKLHGYKPYDFFIKMANECDVFLHPSRTTERNNKEGTPMAIVDAMATGICVISTRHSDIPEILIDGENGYMAEENDLGSLENCILKIFTNLESIEELGAKARDWVEKEFDARKQTLKLEEHYIRLIQGHQANE